MGTDEGDKKPTSSPPRTLSEIDLELARYLRRMEAMERSLQANNERARWLTDREAAKSNEILDAFSKIEQFARSLDRNTDALQAVLRAEERREEHLQFIRGAVNHLVNNSNIDAVVQRAFEAMMAKRGQPAGGESEPPELPPVPLPPPHPRLPGRHKVAPLSQDGTEAIAETVREAIREATDKHPLLTEKDISDSPKLSFVLRLYNLFVHADPLAKIITLLVVVMAFSLLIGYGFYRMRVAADVDEPPALERPQLPEAPAKP